MVMGDGQQQPATGQLEECRTGLPSPPAAASVRYQPVQGLHLRAQQRAVFLRRARAGTKLIAWRRCLTIGRSRTDARSRLIRARSGRGVPAGASRPCEVSGRLNSGIVSASEGTSGARRSLRRRNGQRGELPLLDRKQRDAHGAHGVVAASRETSIAASGLP